MAEGEYTSREMAEVREWLVRLDTKLDMMHDVRKTAETADRKADKALQQNEDNAKDITSLDEKMATGFDGIKKAAMWAVGTMITFTGVLVAFIAILLK